VHACALCDIQRGSACALLSMWVHAYFFSAICNEHWVLISFGHICLSYYPCSCGYTLTIPPPHTLPYYPQTKHPSCALSQFKTIGGDSLPRSAAAKLMIGARQRRLCFSSCSSLPAPWPAKISHLASHPHNTLAYKLSLFTCLSNNIPLRGVLTTLMALNVGSKGFTPECESPHALAKCTKEP